MLIYHVTLPANWEKYKGRPSYQTESLHTEGFIHCSYENQLEAVLKRYFASAVKVTILTIDTEKLKSKLVSETSTGGAAFPHNETDHEYKAHAPVLNFASRLGQPSCKHSEYTRRGKYIC